MKKCSIIDVLDNVFWYIIYILPILAYLISICGHGDSSLTIIDYFNQFFPLATNVISSSLVQIFGSNGILPLFEDGGYIIDFLTYFISCMIIHLAVDFLLFIPRLAHKWLDGFVSRGGSLR